MADIKNILEEIKNLSVVELNELVKSLEGEFGVSAAAMAVAAPAGAAAAPEEEKTEFTVVLKSFDAAGKIGAIKVVREITGLGLSEAKALVESAPSTIKENVAKASAQEMVAKFKEVNAVAELK